MTKLLVLGMLDKQPMSGYDIQNYLQVTDAKRWGGVLSGSIYYALSKLEREQYIQIQSVERCKIRQKAIYSITEKGKECLKRLVCDYLKIKKVSYPSELYNAISFLEILDKETAIVSLEESERRLEEELKMVQKGLEEKRETMNGEMPKKIELIFENMFSIIKEDIKLVRQLIENL